MANSRTPEKPEAAREASPLENFWRMVQQLRDNVDAHPLMREDRLPSIGRELAYAVTDIRQRLLEEAWSGQIQTPHHRDALDTGRGDPLGRSSENDPFRERCRETHAARGPEPEGGVYGIDR